MQNIKNFFEFLLFPFMFFLSLHRQRDIHTKKFIIITVLMISVGEWQGLHAESEPNNSCSNANILLDTSSQTNSGWMNGTVTNNSDYDWYKIVLTQKAEIRFDRNTRNNKKTKVKLYKSNCSSSAGWYSNSKNSNKTLVLASGTYFLRVWRSNSNNAQYKVKAYLKRLMDLSITKSVDSATHRVGDTVVYTITVHNSGPEKAWATIRDTLPSGLTYQSQSGCSHSGNGIACNKTIYSGDSKTITLRATVDSGASGTITNNADVVKNDNNSNGKKRFDTDLSNNSASADVTINQGCGGCDCSLDDNTQNSTSPGITIPGLNGATADITKCISGITDQGDGTPDKNDYYHFTVGTDGILKITTSSPNGHDYHMQVWLNGNSVYNDTIGQTHNIHDLILESGDQVTVWFKETGNDLDEYQATFDFHAIDIVNNADDLCYEEKELDGLMCIDIGICGGGFGCKNTYPIKNIGDNTIDDVQIVFNEDSWSGSFFGNCGVDPSGAGSCDRAENLGFGPFGFFGQATVYDFNNPIPIGDNSNKFWFKNFMSGWCFPTSDIYGSYIKDGKLYRGQLQSCADVKPKDPNFVQCGLFPSALNTWEDINRGNGDIVIDADTIYANNVSGTGGSAQDIQCEVNGTTQSCNVLPMTEPVPTLPTFISSHENTSKTAASTESDAEYGDLTVDADVHFSPVGTYTNGNPVMLIKSLTVNNGATVTFDSGDYWIGSMTVHAGTKIRTNGKVRLFINNNLDLTENHLDINYDGGNGTPANLFIFVYGDVEFASNGGGDVQDMAAYLYTEGTYTANFNTANSHYKGAVTAVGDINLNNNQEYIYDTSGLINGWGACINCVKVNFAKDQYNISEDINYIGTTETVFPVIKLEHPVGYDVTVHYYTIDGTAKVGDGDYIGVSDETVTIPAGDSNVSIPIHIYNDAPIELDEYFHVQLTDPSPSGQVCLGDVNRTRINILAQEDSPTCFEDDFSNGLDSKWRVLRSVGGFTPQVVNVNGDYRLRITPDERDIATVITKDYQFTTRQNLIIVEFDYYAYGGCSGGGLGTDGADGIVNVLFDSSVGSSPTPGGRGGSMGYAQIIAGSLHQNGFEGGWLGLGIDEYGNFGNCNEGREGGLPGTSCDWNSGFNPQSHRNTAVIRGDGNNLNGYEFLKGVELTQPPLNQPKVAKKTNYGADGYYSGRYKMTVDARDPNHLYIRLQRSLDKGATWTTIINQFDAKDPQYNQGATPDFVRYAISGGTGGGCNNHELSWIKLRGNCAIYGGASIYTAGPFEAWDTYRGDTDGDGKIDDKNISTKLAGRPFELTIASMAADAETLELKPGIDSKFALYWIDDNDIHHPYDGTFYPFNASSANAITHSFQVNAAYKKMYVRIQYCADQNSSGGMILKPYSDCNSQTALWEGEPVSNTTQGIHLRYHQSDMFAVRPEKFVLKAPSNQSMNLLHAGAYNKLTLYAYNYNSTTPTMEYNQQKSNLQLQTKKYFSDGQEDTAGVLTGTVSFGDVDFNMSDGISTNGNNHDVADITYDDVGKIQLHIEDTDWAYIDVISGYNANQNCQSENEPFGIKICGDFNMTYIPDHFGVTAPTLHNHNDSSFTYLANDWDMSASFETTMTAENAKGGITRNFRKDAGSNKFYENPVNVTIAYNGSTPGGTTFIKHDITNEKLGFDNGSYLLTWNETNQSKFLAIRMSRVQTQPVNPFVIKGSDINISVTSLYTDASQSETIKGSSIGNGKATFLYGRIHAPRYRVTQSTGSLPVYFEFYYDVAPSTDSNTTISSFGTGNDRSKDAIYWYTNTKHQSGDGNITNIAQFNNSDLTLGYNVGVTNGVQYFNYSYNGTDFPYRATIRVKSQPWLIYTPYDPNPDFVEIPLEINSDTAAGSSNGFNTSGDSDAKDAVNRPRRIRW